MSGQLPLAIGGLSAPDFESFWEVVDPLPATRLRALARAPGAARILLTGAAHTGKTHLLLATCAAAQNAGQSTLYLPLGEFDAAALADPGTADLIALDDADRAYADRELCTAMFALVNAQGDRGRALLIAARAAPDADCALPDLASRLAQAERLRLSEHGDDARRAILLHRATRAGIPLEPAAVDWLLRHNARDLTTLMQLLQRLDREALARGRRITVPLLRELLGS